MSKVDKTESLRNDIDKNAQELMELITNANGEEVFKGWMKQNAQFWNYSFNNRMLLMGQWNDRMKEDDTIPEATRFASFTTWKRLKRKVKKGSKGLKILAPSPRKHFLKSEASISSARSRGQLNHGKDGKPYTSWMSFRVDHCFEYSQTEGEDLKTLDTDAEAKTDISVQIETLKSYIQSLGITLEYEDGLDNLGTSYGNRIKIRSGMDQGQEFRTLCHELAHELLHWKAQGVDNNHGTSIEEMEAESTAYLVGTHFDVDMSNSRFYIASWGGDVAKMQKSLQRIHKATKAIITAVEYVEPKTYLEVA